MVTDDEGISSDHNISDDPLPDDAFLMVTQLPWENNILYYVPPSNGPPKTAQGKRNMHLHVNTCYVHVHGHMM